MAGTATAISSTDALSSPSSSSTAWDLAVPLGPEADTITPKRTSNESSSLYNKPNYRHRTPNGHPRSRTSSQTGSRRGSNAHDSYGREIGPMTKDMADAYSNGHVWKGDYSGKPPVDTEGMPSDDNWIHRDKLARIESEELQQAAMRIQHRVRTGSKSSSMRGRSHDTQSFNGTITTPPEQTEPWAGSRQQLESPIPLEDSDEQEIEVERRNWDLRRPEEIAASSSEVNDDSSSSKFYKSPALKKSSSRIPVLASSPHQVSSDPNEPSPEPADSTTPPLSTSRPSSRAGMLSQAQSSPTKKAPTKGTTTARKSSAPPNNRKPSGAAKQRATSGSSTSRDRPVTRSGDNRPTTSANPPEGDPPWLATMYKPDPRLPPDQQMLPTHAKRMQQELWEKEGKTPTTYDREFAPLAVQPDEPAQLAPAPEEKNETTTDGDNSATESTSQWPLQPKSPEPTRPGTSGTNYSTMPKVQTAPQIPLPTTPRVPANMFPPPPEEKEKVEKGCGCCIVM
ncbi:conserved hypothetical protein [Talaromyces stipitatus ATCC 10500]|uniref:TeaA receptor TeaR n=1 Tax=Talaromyces stipitatus (strain ATCC 10500 / CBS 375.48 / QM 6759 / NRRL 1006) TaxID=441959 RepID=B8M837_TALSN|nr:uncharacterized protein TSTA_032540 [Talaromyces stipitatus ATCC 10500]EED19999.1 conserved hypothetical protein [Talaromyces stipitatus ATCC 10500]